MFMFSYEKRKRLVELSRDHIVNLHCLNITFIVIVVLCVKTLTVRACGMEMCCDVYTACFGKRGTRGWRGNHEPSTSQPLAGEWNRFAFSRNPTSRTVVGCFRRWRCCRLAAIWKRSCIPYRSVWASDPKRCWKRPSMFPLRRRCIQCVGSSHRYKTHKIETWMKINKYKGQKLKAENYKRRSPTYYLYSKAMLAISFLRARYTLSENPGWSMSSSGSYLVTRWLQLSKSRACLGNHGLFTFMLSSARIVMLANVELCLSIFIRANRSFRVMSTLAKMSNWTPCSLDGLDSKWTTLPFPFCVR